MIRYLFRVERGTIVHFLKWGLALLALVIALWLALALLWRPGVAGTADGRLAGWQVCGGVLDPGDCGDWRPPGDPLVQPRWRGASDGTKRQLPVSYRIC